MDYLTRDTVNRLDVVDGLFRIWKAMTNKALRINGTNSRNIPQNVLDITGCNRFFTSFSSLPHCSYTPSQKKLLKRLHKNVEWRVKFYLKTLFPETLNFTSYNNFIKTSGIDVLKHILKHFHSSGAKPLWYQMTGYRKNLPCCSYRKLSCFCPKQE